MENAAKNEVDAPGSTESNVEHAGQHASTVSDPERKPGSGHESRTLQDDLAEMKDKYLRLFADFENYKRRTAKERLELIQTASEKVVKELLAVLDDFDRAEKAFREKSDKESEGFFLIQNKFKKVLESQGVKVMDTSSLEFDPDVHDAITQIPAPSEALKGKIIDVVEKGYLLNEKVIRHAKVVIGS